MTRLPSLTARQVIAALKRFGYFEHHQTGSHVALRHPQLPFRVVVPYHTGDVPRGTLRAIVKQAGLSEDQFLGLL
jgi:predicted RNA binding protein YcfA (HicA-like mRNA interferase family)